MEFRSLHVGVLARGGDRRRTRPRIPAVSPGCRVCSVKQKHSSLRNRRRRGPAARCRWRCRCVGLSALVRDPVIDRRGLAELHLDFGLFGREASSSGPARRWRRSGPRSSGPCTSEPFSVRGRSACRRSRSPCRTGRRAAPTRRRDRPSRTTMRRAGEGRALRSCGRDAGMISAIVEPHRGRCRTPGSKLRDRDHVEQQHEGAERQRERQRTLAAALLFLGGQAAGSLGSAIRSPEDRPEEAEAVLRQQGREQQEEVQDGEAEKLLRPRASPARPRAGG